MHIRCSRHEDAAELDEMKDKVGTFLKYLFTLCCTAIEKTDEIEVTLPASDVLVDMVSDSEMRCCR